METQTRKSYCRLCTACCGVLADLEDGRLVRIRGDGDDPVTAGYSCSKGRQLPHQVHGPQRLRSSLKRLPDGSFVPIPTEQALDEIAAKLEALIAAHGPRSVASFCGTAAYSNSTSVPVVRAWHAGIGSTSNYSTLTIDQPAKIVAIARHGVWGGGPHSFASSDVALTLGINPLVSGLSIPGGVPGTNPVRTLEDACKRGLELICIDPRRSELARRAAIHLQVRPGEDASLLAGMIRVILAEGLHDAAFCSEHSEGLDALRAAVEPFTPEYVEARAEIPRDQLALAARLFARGPRGSASSGTGADMSARPCLTGHLLCALNTLCGRHNRAGDRLPNPGVLALPVPRPAQAIPEELLPPILSWRQGPPARVRGLHGMFQEMPSSTLAEEILLPGEGQIRALLCVGGNPLVSMPDPHAMRRAYASLELRVAVDIQLSATARESDYVIAARQSLEREDVSEFMDAFYEVPYAHYTRAVVEPEEAAEGVDDFEVFIGLARRMKTKLELPGGVVDTAAPPAKLDLLKQIFPATRIPMERLRAQIGGHVYDELDERVSDPLPGIEGRLALAPEGVAEELAELHAESHGAEVDGEYTWRLITRRMPDVSNTVGHDFPATVAKGGNNPAYMHPDDLAALGVESGGLVELASRHATVHAIAQASDEIRPGVVSIAHCFGDAALSDAGVPAHGTNTGLLVATDRDYDPITGMTRQSAIPIRVRAADMA